MMDIPNIESLTTIKPEYEYCGDSIVDAKFYLEPTVVVDGHLFKVVIMYHDPRCPCFEN